VRAELDRNKYRKRVKVSDAQFTTVNLTRHTFHGDWNYSIAPRSRRTKWLGYWWTCPKRTTSDHEAFYAAAEIDPVSAVYVTGFVLPQNFIARVFRNRDQDRNWWRSAGQYGQN
jgi:Rhodopirellula transposase DDE domain